MHFRQASEINPSKSRIANYWQRYTHESLVHWYSNQVVMKSVPCHWLKTINLFTHHINVTKISFETVIILKEIMFTRIFKNQKFKN